MDTFSAGREHPEAAQLSHWKKFAKPLIKVLRRLRLSLPGRGQLSRVALLSLRMAADVEATRVAGPVPQKAGLTDGAALVLASYAMTRQAKAQGQFGTLLAEEASRHYAQSGLAVAGYEAVRQLNVKGGVSGAIFYQATAGQVVLTLDGTNDRAEWLVDLASAVDLYGPSRVNDAARLIADALALYPEAAVLVAAHSLGGQDAQLGAQLALLTLKSRLPGQNHYRRVALLKFDPLDNPGLQNNIRVEGVPLSEVQPRQAVLTADPGMVSTFYPHRQVYRIPQPVGVEPPFGPVAWMRYQHQLFRYTAAGGRIPEEATLESVLRGEPLRILAPRQPDSRHPLTWLSVPLGQVSDHLHSILISPDEG